MYISDILPTLASAANISFDLRNLDGVDQWQVISEDWPSTRKEVLYNIETVLSYSAVMIDGWKLVNGTENIKNAKWLGTSGNDLKNNFENYVEEIQESDAAKCLTRLTSKDIQRFQEKLVINCGNSTVTKCNPLESACLFNIIDDPCELHNLAHEHPKKS